MQNLQRQAARTVEPVFLSAADARRMEAAEEYGALRYAQAMRSRRPEWGTTWEEFCGGDLIFVARRSPVSRARLHFLQLLQLRAARPI